MIVVRALAFYAAYFVFVFGDFAFFLWRSVCHKPKRRVYDGPPPPGHPNCRCIVAPVLDLDDRPQTLPDKPGYLNRW
jgi:hypothetical protein